MLICHCSVVSDTTIRESIEAGARDLLDIASATGAGAFCGGCQPAIAAILGRATHAAPSELVASAPATVAGRAASRRPGQAVARTLEEDIVALGWDERRSLGTEHELATRYETSQGVLRQALAILEHHGIIDSVRGRRGKVLTGSPNLDAVVQAGVLHLLSTGMAASELLDARRIVDVEVARQATRNAEPADIHGLRESVAAAYTGSSLEHSDFHERLGQITGNPVLALLSDLLTRIAREHVAGVRGGPADRALAASETITRDHHAIIDAIASGNEEHAVAAVHAHLDSHAGWLDPPHTRFSPTMPQGGNAIEVARSIAIQVARQGLVPGSAVGTLEDLATSYAVPMATMRQALALLEYYSVCSVLPGPSRTVAVSLPDAWPAAQLIALHLDRVQATVRQIREALDPLELWATGQAASVVTEEAARRLRQRLAEEATVIDRDGVANNPFRFSVNHNIHPLIAELSGNRAVALFASACNLALVRAVAASQDQRTRRSSTDAELVAVHADIVDAVSRGDRASAERLMADHLDGYWRHQDPTVNASEPLD